MQWSLFVLILMGQCAFFTCHLYEYHFIDEAKTWREAQQYCSDHYTDLATVTNMADMNRLCDVTEDQDGAWIGLHNEPGTDSRVWHWSLPGVEFNESETKWASGQPDDRAFPGNCVRLPQRQNDKWADQKCSHPYKFICYDEKKKDNKTFHFINVEKTWPDAQSHCRQRHTDLVSGLHQLEDPKFKAERPSDEDLWIGLFRDTWRWSDGSNSSFRQSDLHFYKNENNKNCTMTENGRWRSEDCTENKPFVCYDDKVILIKQELTWEDALKYCRENHSDLVSITNRYQQRWVQERAKQADTGHIWVGLLYSCFLDLWFWINDNVVCYDNWAPGKQREGCDWAAAMSKGAPHKWFMKRNNEKFNFICTVKKV